MPIAAATRPFAPAQTLFAINACHATNVEARPFLIRVATVLALSIRATTTGEVNLEAAKLPGVFRADPQRASLGQALA